MSPEDIRSEERAKSEYDALLSIACVKQAAEILSCVYGEGRGIDHAIEELKKRADAAKEAMLRDWEQRRKDA